MHGLTSDLAAARGDTAWRPRPWQVWLIASAMLLLIALPQALRFAPSDPDDYMRLLQVRDWLGGQSWWDVRQYRMDPPAGADMHWSRLVDLPIAVFLLVFRLFLDERSAQIAAMCAVPLLQLGVAMALARRLVRALGGSADMALAACALLPVFPLLTSNFLPLRIDHHGWQAVAALACAALLVRGGYRSALIAGVVAAAWQTISLEGLALAAALGALFAARYWLWGRREHEAFLIGLAGAGPLLFLATRPLSAFSTAHCDQLSWPHFLAFAAAATLAAASRILPGQQRSLGRFAALLLIAPAAAAILVPLGPCAVNPFVGLDPVLRHFWLDNVSEGLPIWRQSPSVAAMLLWTIALVLAGARIALREAADARHRQSWAFLALFALAAGVLSLWVMRAALAAQLLAVPFAAALLLHYLPRARALRSALPRVLATLACIGLATPLVASAALKPFDAWPGAQSVSPSAAATEGPCDLDRLNALPRATLFAPLDLGPEILARTPHSVVMGPYHRNQAKMRQVVDAFAGPLAGAPAIVESSGAAYVVACIDDGRLDAYAVAGPDNLADLIVAGRAAAWLAPVGGFERGSLRVYRVR
jgi:hypothetical protein